MKLRIAYTLLFGYLLNLYAGCSSGNENAPLNTSQPSLEFLKTFGGSKNESAQSITKTFDGGYAILGFTQSMDGDILNKSNDTYDYWLLKFDANNALQWQKTYGGTDEDRGSSIIQTSDNGYLIIGFSKSIDGDISTNEGSNDFWVSKLDAKGTIIWKKSFGYSGLDNGISVIQANDGGYLLIGILDVSASGGLGNTKYNSTKHAGGDFWAIKLNASGEKQWSRYYGGTFTDTPYGGIQTEDNGYIIVGSSDSSDFNISNNLGSYDFWVIKISNLGDLIWERSFGGSQIDEARAITSSGDGNYLIVGDTRSNDLNVSKNNGAADVWLIKISPSGDLIWEKSFGGSSFDVGRSISRTQDNGFIIAGSSRSSDIDLSKNNGQNDAWVFKIDSNGNVKWSETVGGTDIDFAYSMAVLNDGTIVVAGESNSSELDIPINKGFTDLLVFNIK